MKIGIKIWSINHSSFSKLLEFYKKGLIDYVELYVVPNSFDEKKLKPLKEIQIIFHAPNFHHGFDLSKSDKHYHDSIATIKEFSAFFNERRVIFHPGDLTSAEKKDVSGTINNILKLKKEFDVILENVPRLGIDRKLIMLLSDYDEFKVALANTKVKFCLDFGHAIASSNYYKKRPIMELKKFASLDPYMCHISDGIYSSDIDNHKHFGEGDFPLKDLLSFLRPGTPITLETPKKDYINLKEDLKNLKKIRIELKRVEKKKL